jgi:hypothetical protein
MRARITVDSQNSWFDGYRATALAMVAIFLVLLLGSSTCISSASRTHHAEGHHSGSSEHSSLCAWACQALSEHGLVASAPDAPFGQVFETSIRSSLTPIFLSHIGWLSVRAPPAVDPG